MIEPGTLLQDRYLLTAMIGQGGMGAVYIATDKRFGSTVAVKETFFTDPNLRKAFEREARLLNSLRHTALPRVSDHFVEAEGQFLVMEFISGDDLSSMLEKNGGPFPVDRVLGWAEQLLDALEYLHEQTPPIIHRDIKPQNLKLTDRDHIILLDFGLAKGSPANLSRVTNTGSVFGYSRSYAPLEQIQGAGTDTRSDLYSLSATLYHLITGVTPPDAVTRATAVINGQHDPMSPASDVNPLVPADVAGVLGRALAQNANQRPASAREMRQALRIADRTPGAGRGTQANAAPVTIFDQATQILSPQTNAMTDAAAFSAGVAANTVPDPKLQGTSPLDQENGAGKSVLTVVATPPGKPRQNNRALWLIAAAAAIVILGGSAFGLYRYAQRTPATSESAPANPVQSSTTAPTVPVQTSPTPAAPTPTPAVADTRTSSTGQKEKPVTTKNNKTTVDKDDKSGDDESDKEPPDPDDKGKQPPPDRQVPQPPNGDQGDLQRRRAENQQRRIQMQVDRDMQRRQKQQQRRNGGRPGQY